MSEITEKTAPPSALSAPPGSEGMPPASTTVREVPSESAKKLSKAALKKLQPKPASKNIRDNIEDEAKAKAVKKPRKKGTLYYAIPSNLAREIRLLGYEFSAKRILLTYVLIIGIMVGVGLAFKLPFGWIIPLVVAGLLFAPKIVRNSYRNRFERQRLSDVNVYIEQVLYAFKNSQKILTSLEDVRVLFPGDSPMLAAIDEAIHVITDPNAVGAEDIAEVKALALIEARYDNDHVRSTHRFMLKVESVGGNFDSSIDLLLNGRAMWENRVHDLQDQRGQRRSQILGSVVASAALCGLMLYILPSEVSIADSVMVQAANTFMIIIFTAIYLKADTKLSSDLLRSRTSYDDARLLREYNKFITYDPQAGMRTSMKFSIIPVVIIALGVFVFHNTWVIVAGVVLLPIMMFQHLLGHKLLSKRLRREIGVAFPQWLLELALLLQSDNVQVGMFKTIDTALPIMRPELEKLRERLLADPASSEPFLLFFKDFDMPEVTTSMQMLYSLSIGSGGEAEEQIANIVERNNKILDRAEQASNRDSLAGLQLLFMLPVLLGGLVLMVSMTAFLLGFVTSMGL